MTHIAISNPHCITRQTFRTRLLNMLSLARQRRALARLDDRALADIGLSRSEAQTEAARPIWDTPDNWHNQLY
ncbi:conserved domain protein [Rhodobacteraceae bacterium KLH11]|nr:conserved domain protein [Rhodobacteraceae bacterium KLH11]